MHSTILFFKKLTLAKKLLLLLSPVLILILEMKTTLIALCIVIFIDLITGIRKSLHLKGLSFNPLKKEFWRTVSSEGMRSTWRKTYEYGIGIITFVVIDSLVFDVTVVEIMGNKMSISELAITTACLVELYSIYENMEAVSGNNLFKRILYLFPQRFRDLFKNK